MSKLLVKPSEPDSHGRIHAITPESAAAFVMPFGIHLILHPSAFPL